MKTSTSFEVEYATKYFYELHDSVCNQKYAPYLPTPLPYSFHLEMVKKQGQLFQNLIVNDEEFSTVLIGCVGHDAIEDGNVSYNDMKDMFGFEVAEIIYLCSEERGRTRADRHSEKYYLELADNRLAVFVKLCDIIANVKFGLLTNSSMLPKYKKEYAKTKEYLYREEFDPMFKYLESIFNL